MRSRIGVIDYLATISGMRASPIWSSRWTTTPLSRWRWTSMPCRPEAPAWPA